MRIRRVCQNPTCDQLSNFSNTRFCSLACWYAVHTLPMSQRFWSKVAICQHGMDCPYCCWEWQAGKAHCGYGSFHVKTRGGWRPRRAHRKAWELINEREIPNGLKALHHCDNPPCCSIWHIYIGTSLDNMRDARQRGRLCVGEQHGWLKQEDALTIKELYRQGSTLLKIAQEFNIGFTAVWHILHGKTWKDFPVALEEEELISLASSHRARGTRHGRATLTEDQVRLLRSLHHDGVGVTALARQFGIPHKNVKNVCSGRTWKHLL
jgi:hypothetical protein